MSCGVVRELDLPSFTRTVRGYYNSKYDKCLAYGTPSKTRLKFWIDLKLNY